MRWNSVAVLGKSAIVRGDGCYLSKWQQGRAMMAGTLSGLSAILLLAGQDPSLILRASLVAVLACLSVYAFGAALISVEIDEQGVMIRNGWRRSLVSWSDFAAFIDVQRYGRHDGYVRRRDGSRSPCAILRARGLIGGRREVEELVGQLNQIADRLRPPA